MVLRGNFSHWLERSSSGDVDVIDLHVSGKSRITHRYPLFMHRNVRIIRGFGMVKNSPGNDNGAARVDGRRSGASRGECVRGWGRNNVFRRRHFYRAPPLYPSLLLFPMLYVNCTVKSHYIRAQCVHYTPCQKHFYPLEFFSSSIHLLSLALASLAPFFLFFSFGAKHSLNLFVRATQRSNLFH